MTGRIVRIDLPAHLRTLAQVKGEVRVAVTGAVTLRTVVDALEAEYPVLGGTIREYGSGQRRAFLRFFAGEEDLSHDGMDVPLPEAVARGEEALLVVGAVAGGVEICRSLDIPGVIAGALLEDCGDIPRTVDESDDLHRLGIRVVNDDVLLHWPDAERRWRNIGADNSGGRIGGQVIEGREDSSLPTEGCSAASGVDVVVTFQEIHFRII